MDLGPSIFVLVTSLEWLRICATSSHVEYSGVCWGGRDAEALRAPRRRLRLTGWWLVGALPMDEGAIRKGDAGYAQSCSTQALRQATATAQSDRSGARYDGRWHVRILRMASVTDLRVLVCCFKNSASDGAVRWHAHARFITVIDARRGTARLATACGLVAQRRHACALHPPYDSAATRNKCTYAALTSSRPVAAAWVSGERAGACVPDGEQRL